MLTITKTEKDTTCVTLELKGRIDSTTSPQLEAQLLPEYESARNVKLNFAELDYISSAGLRVLLVGVKKANEKSAKQTLVNVSPEILEVFEMTGFDNVLNIE